MAAPPRCLGWLLFRLDLLPLWREAGRRREVLVEGLQRTLHPLRGWRLHRWGQGMGPTLTRVEDKGPGE